MYDYELYPNLLSWYYMENILGLFCDSFTCLTTTCIQTVSHGTRVNHVLLLSNGSNLSIMNVHTWVCGPYVRVMNC